MHTTGNQSVGKSNLELPFDIKNLAWSERLSMKMLRYFYVASHSQNLTQAAERLHISKSPLSAQMRELEAILNVVLFNRQQRSLQLTAAGILLRDECAHIFTVIEGSVNKVCQFDREQQEHLRFGIISSIYWAGFSSACQQLKKQYPKFQFEFIELSPMAQKEALVNNDIDIGIVRYADTLNIKPLVAATLYTESMCVALSKKHKFSARKRLCLSELSDEKFVMMKQKNSASSQLIVQHCIKEGFITQIAQEVIEPMTLMNVLEDQEYISIVPQSFAKQSWNNMCFVALKQPIVADICAIYCAQTISTQKQMFIESLRVLMSTSQRN
ncbi:LysR family transcriptional regulator [Psychromonas sp. CNPT3]|uniref:LysR family transcriptional regulator n=1 Tax=Psychromonas sp. CNPT3 TaxID=314282 RepID=UPI0002C1402A|nr:LysR family transcriptional regulator [Psychromonas sp. CNPT3]AGH82253.1 LysR family transcriptional regulator [Psychromonas sp. CNPT3]